MKIPPKDIDSFIINIPKALRAVLLYGPDNGLMKIRSSIIEKSYNISRKFNYDQVKNDASLLVDSLNSLSLFAENLLQEKMVIVECGDGGSITESCSSLLKEGNFKGVILFCAGDLSADSALRKLFENNDNMAAIACYHDDLVSISKLIQQTFKSRQMNIQPSAVQLIMNSIALGDRMLVISEIEKICLFLGEKKVITDADLQDYLESQGEVNFDRLCYKLSLKEGKDLESLLAKLQNEGHNLISITRMLIRHFYRLYQVRHLMAQGKEESQAMASLSPPVFFKQANDFSRSLKLWKDVELFEMLKMLTELELLAKQNPITAEISLKKIFLKSCIS